MPVRRRGREDPRWSRRREHAGPVVTTLAVLFVLACFSGLFSGPCFEPAEHLRQTAKICAALAILSCILTHVVNPGAPTPQPQKLLDSEGASASAMLQAEEGEAISSGDEAPPVDESDEKQRIRWRGKGHERWQQKWCKDCKLWRPKQCGHCSACKQCVTRLDHHCGWMGNCIGEHNLRFFAAFLFFAGVGCMCLTATGVHRIAQLGCFGEPTFGIITVTPPPATCKDGIDKYVPFVDRFANLTLDQVPVEDAQGLSKCFDAAGEVVLILVALFFMCPMSLFAAGFGLTGAGFMYLMLILVDIDMPKKTRRQLMKEREAGRSEEDEEEKEPTSADIAADMAGRVLRCQGVRALCCAPLACRRDCSQDIRRCVKGDSPDFSSSSQSEME